MIKDPTARASGYLDYQGDRVYTLGFRVCQGLRPALTGTKLYFEIPLEVNASGHMKAYPWNG